MNIYLDMFFAIIAILIRDERVIYVSAVFYSKTDPDTRAHSKIVICRIANTSFDHCMFTGMERSANADSLLILK